MRDVARAADVSTATVSRVLNEDAARGSGAVAKVSGATRERVLAAALRLDYRLNHVARSLKTRSTRTVAILAPELANDFFMELAEGMERELGKAGYMLLLSSSSNSAEEEKRRLRVLSQRLVDGIIVVPASRRGEHIQAIADGGTPVVLVDRLVEGAALDSVLADNEGGAYAATRALLDDGFRRIAFLGGNPALSTAQERLSGFERAIADAGLTGRDVRPGGMGIADGYSLMDELMAEAEPPEALFAVNLLVHLGMERRLLEEGRAALGRFAMASFDETPYSPFMSACRYSVAQPAADMGAAAARLLLERIALADGRGGKSSGGGSVAWGGEEPGIAATPQELAPRCLRLGTRLIRR